MNILTTKPGDREITLPLNKLQRRMHAKMFGVFSVLKRLLKRMQYLLLNQ